MREFRMEVDLILRKKRKKEIRLHKSLHGSLLTMASVMLKYVILDFHGKLKIEHFSLHPVQKENEISIEQKWYTLMKLLGSKIMHTRFAKIVILALLNFGALVFLVHQGTINAKLGYNYAEGETMAEEPLSANLTINEIHHITKFESAEKSEGLTSEDKKLAEDLNSIINSQDEKCKESKDKKRCTEECVKNEEELIAQMKEEERKAWRKYVASKPKLLGPSPSRKISCPKDTKGARNSPDKGKHMDEDCCPDPDEWPKPGCRYSAAGLALMLKGPHKSK